MLLRDGVAPLFKRRASVVVPSRWFAYMTMSLCTFAFLFAASLRMFFFFILICFPSLRHDPEVAAHRSGERFLVHLADLAARLLVTPCCTPTWLCVPPIQKSAAQRQSDNGGNIGAAAAAAISSGVHQARDPNRYARLCTHHRS